MTFWWYRAGHGIIMKPMRSRSCSAFRSGRCSKNLDSGASSAARSNSHGKKGTNLMASDELEKRITMLEDIEAIKQLKALYCAVCDDDHNPDMIATLFAADGIWEGADIGRHQGHAAIRKLFESFRDRISFSQHNV